MAPICRRHPITTDEIAQLLELIDAKLDALRANRLTKNADLASLFSLRSTLTGMSGMPGTTQPIEPPPSGGGVS